MGLIVDSFAGGGGASTGLERALGRPVDLAINHDYEAISMHRANHPETEHLINDIWQIDPVKATRGQPVDLAWFSPDCKHFSKAKGGKPVEKKIRDLAWIVVEWAKKVRPRIIMLENVEEFQDWGPLLEDGRPCPDQRGFEFRRWDAAIRHEGYRSEFRQLRGCDYGTPTIRKRLFYIARCDGLPIVWPKPTHGAGLLPYRTAADIIDWSLPCHSIFLSREEGRKVGVNRPLAPATMARIAKGVQRYVVNATKPFIVTMAHGSTNPHAARSVDEPMRTLTASHDGHGLVVPYLAGCGGRAAQSPPKSADEPINTLTTKGSQQNLVAAHLLNLKGSDGRMSPADAPAPTQTAGGWHIAEVRAFLTKYYGSSVGQSLFDPSHTATTRARLGLVVVEGTEYQIVDIGMRMLTARELFCAQGFPLTYIIDPIVGGKRLSKTAQIRMCGNSVNPQISEALARANIGTVADEDVRVA